MTLKVLLVDDEENILQAYFRNLRKTFDLEVAMGGVQALRAMQDHGPFAVIVADMRMPGMTGLDVFHEAQKRYPDTTRIMLTGNLDQRTAADAVNEGRVFRFLTKPCPPESLALAIQAGIRQHQLVTAEKELLEQTLMGSLQVFTDLLSNLDPEAFGRGGILRERALALARDLEFDLEWDLETAALLLPIGRITLPPEFLAKLRAGGPLEPRERAILDGIPEIGARLLRNIPRLMEVSLMVQYHAKGFDGSGSPMDGILGEGLPLGARILKALNDFTHLELRRKSREVALEELGLRASQYDPRVLKALFARFGTPASALLAAQPVACRVLDLREGMVLDRSIVIPNGRPILLAGLQLGTGHLELLRSVTELLDIQEPVYVRKV